MNLGFFFQKKKKGIFFPLKRLWKGATRRRAFSLSWIGHCLEANSVLIFGEHF